MARYEPTVTGREVVCASLLVCNTREGINGNIAITTKKGLVKGLITRASRAVIALRSKFIRWFYSVPIITGGRRSDKMSRKQLFA